MNWRWISKQALALLHGESLATYGGREGMRNEGWLESALMHPQNTMAYADADNPPDSAAPASSYGVGIAKNPPFWRWQQARGVSGGGYVSLSQRLAPANQPG